LQNKSKILKEVYGELKLSEGEIKSLNLNQEEFKVFLENQDEILRKAFEKQAKPWKNFLRNRGYAV